VLHTLSREGILRELIQDLRNLEQVLELEREEET
jgi:hypothetical protein